MTPEVSPLMLAFPVNSSSMLSSSIPLIYLRALSLSSSAGVCCESIPMIEAFIAVEELEPGMALDDSEIED
jgi:hypothetical protein